MATDGGWIVVGAVNADNQGAAYVFKENDSGTWVQDAMLTPSDIKDIWFGWSVAIDGNRIVVGAPSSAIGGTPSAYVFVLDADGIWVEEERLVGSDTVFADWFGVSVDIHDVYVIAGAYLVPNRTAKGAAYVFKLTDGDWVQDAKLTASNGAIDDAFGLTVSISDDDGEIVAFIGAPWDDNANGTNAGSVYVFSRGASSWTEDENAIASDGAAGDFFGLGIALSVDLGYLCWRRLPV